MSTNLKRGPKNKAKSTGNFDQRRRDIKGNGSDNKYIKPAKNRSKK